MKLNWGRVVAFSSFAIASTAFGYFFGDDLRRAERAVEYIAVIFSILAGALFAVIGIVGDPSMLLSGNWRVGWESARRRHNDIKGFNVLFHCYLITLGMLVVCEIIRAAGAAQFYFVYDIFAAFAAFSFLWSFRVPYRLRQIQKQRLEDEIRDRKKEGSGAGQL